MADLNKVEQSNNEAQIVGTLSEINLEVQQKDLKMEDGTTKKNIDVITRKDFKNPSMTVEVNGNPIGISFFDIPSISRKDGKPNKFYDGALKYLEYTPKSRATEENPATRVSVKGKLAENGYVNDKEEWVSTMQVSGNFVSSTSVPLEDIADCSLTGIIRTIKDEIKSEEETGRLIVEFYTFDYNGKAVPFTLFVEEDLADDFRDLYENGDSCAIDVEVLSKTVGTVKVKKEGGFGRRESKITSGYSTLELSVFHGDEKFEDENKFFIDPKVMKEALAEREIMIEQKKKDKKEKNKDGGNKTSATDTKKGLGTRKAKIETPTEELEESPF